jgi:transcriptional regulator with XRE-family HTH domain
MGEITNRILETLGNQGMSQKEFCEKTGVAQSTFTNWKQRDTDPPANLIPQISFALKVSFAYLLTGEEKQDAGINKNLRKSEGDMSRYQNITTDAPKKEKTKSSCLQSMLLLDGVWKIL